MLHAFPTPDPATVLVEIGSGSVSVTAEETEETTVEVLGAHAADVVVERRGDQVAVVAPRRTGFFGGNQDLTVRVRLPLDSELVTRLGSADLTATGRLGWVQLATGSGDVSLDEVGAEALVKTGSGDIEVRRVAGPTELKTGSGDIAVQQVDGPSRITTGSGDIRIGRTAAAVELKSGSGSIEVREGSGDAALSTASGDVRVGRFPAGQLTARNVSGDIRVGIPAGVPVWTDVTSVTGQVRSSLEGAGRPAEGDPYVEVRAKTVSGDVLLDQLPA